MYMDQDVVKYFQQLNGYLHAQCNKIDELHRLMEKMQREITELKEKNGTPPVLKNEYRFDLLKVEKLEGTLNIGISPSESSKSVDELAVDQSIHTPAQEAKEHDLFPKIRASLDQFFNKEAAAVLACFEEQYACPLDESYRSFILDDVKQQIDKRIRHYLNEVEIDDLPKEQVDKVETEIARKVQRDIERTFDTFIKNLPRTENEW